MNKKWMGSLMAALCFGSLMFIAPTAYAGSSENFSEEELEAREKAKEEKFVQIYKDESYTYYLDKQNMKWVNIPYQEKRMLDVWIKLEPVMTSFDKIDSMSSERDSSTTYYLEHYYIRKDKRQIQFMCELEVNGRPNNDVNTGTYDPRRWENLVPESIEDHIYHGVLEAVDNGMFSSGGSDGGDILEDVFRISL